MKLPRRAVRRSVLITVLGLSLLAAARPGVATALFSADFEQRWFALPGGLITDHTLIRDGAGNFHLFYTVGIAGQGWPQPGNMIDFGHAISSDLVHWTEAPRVLHTAPSGWKSRNLWAPHVIPAPTGGYYMYYTGVDSTLTQAIGAAYSLDLFSWVDFSVAAPAYHPDPSWSEWRPGIWADSRDPFAFRLGSGTAILATALASDSYTGVGNRGAIALGYSSDGVHFTDAGAPLFVNETSRVLESTSLIRRPDRYFLFFHESGTPGIRYMQSPALFSGWDRATTQVLDPIAFAPSEVVSAGSATLMGRCYDTDHSGTIIYGAKFDTLLWASDRVTFGTRNTLADGWTAEGDAFEYQPVYGDLPSVRGAPPSGEEGFFWINTAETYTGPIHHNDPAAPPQFGRTGVLRSRPFTVSGGYMRLLVAGGFDPDRLYVALVDTATGDVLRRVTGNDSNHLVARFFDLNGLAGFTCRVEIVDHRTDGPHGFIAVDGISEELGSLPVGIALDPAPALAPALGVAYPSPARGPVDIPFSLVRDGRVRLALYDVNGRLRLRLLDAPFARGEHRAHWDGRDASGQKMASGTYFLRMETAGGEAARRITIVP